jgi:hypothetical protein
MPFHFQFLQCHQFITSMQCNNSLSSMPIPPYHAKRFLTLCNLCDPILIVRSCWRRIFGLDRVRLGRRWVVRRLLLWDIEMYLSLEFEVHAINGRIPVCGRCILRKTKTWKDKIKGEERENTRENSHKGRNIEEKSSWRMVSKRSRGFFTSTTIPRFNSTCFSHLITNILWPAQTLSIQSTSPSKGNNSISAYCICTILGVAVV